MMAISSNTNDMNDCVNMCEFEFLKNMRKILNIISLWSSELKHSAGTRKIFWFICGFSWSFSEQQKTQKKIALHFVNHKTSSIERVERGLQIDIFGFFSCDFIRPFSFLLIDFQSLFFTFSMPTDFFYHQQFILSNLSSLLILYF